MKALAAEQLSKWLADAGRAQPMLVDVREPWEFEICRIEGSALMPLSASAQQFDAIDPHRAVVCICHHGARSLHVAMALEQRGCADVYNLTGGLDAWARQVDPAMPVY